VVVVSGAREVMTTASHRTPPTPGDRLLVTGSRDWTDAEAIEAELALARPAVVIEGGARGADRLAAAAARRLGMVVAEFPADWERHGRQAGILRNLRLLREGRPDHVLAFHDNLDASRGTAHMCRIALQAGLEVNLVGHDPDVQVRRQRLAPIGRGHQWSASKRGASDPDACPSCGRPTQLRALRPEDRWRWLQVPLLTCTGCGHAWVPEPIAEPRRTPLNSTPSANASAPRR
jgi:hypothetical protein